MGWGGGSGEGGGERSRVLSEQSVYISAVSGFGFWVLDSLVSGFVVRGLGFGVTIWHFVFLGSGLGFGVWGLRFGV